jgi:hypothetical protein
VSDEQDEPEPEGPYRTPSEAPEPEPDPDESPDAIFEALWTRVLEAWDDDKPHQAALSYALQTERLPDIAGRYRKLLDDPEKGWRAKKKIDGIVVAATQLLMATKTPKREKIPWQWTMSVAAVFVLVVAFLAYKLLVHG